MKDYKTYVKPGYTASDKDWYRIVNDDNYTFYCCTKTMTMKAETLEQNRKRLDVKPPRHTRRGQAARVEAFLHSEKLKEERERARNTDPTDEVKVVMMNHALEYAKYMNEKGKQLDENIETI